jgi:hypothetical protein
MGEGSPRQVSAAIAMLRALARPERLALLTALGSDPVGIGALSERTGIPVRSLAKEVGRLESAGLVTIDKGTITATLDAMARLAEDLEQTLPIVAIVQRHDLERFFKHGRLVAIPVDVANQAALAAALVELIPAGETLTEAEVNRMLGAVSPDHATLRRLLVDFGHLERGAGVDYRRIPSVPAA